MSISRSRRVETAAETLARLEREIRELRATVSARSGGTLIDLTPYTKTDGSRAFTAVVAGVTPTAAAHLATKGYVDTAAPAATEKREHLTFTVTGEVETGDQGFRWITPYDITLVGLQLSCGAGLGPTGAALEADFLDDGVTCFSTPASIPDGDDDGVQRTPSTVAVAAGSVLTLNVGQIGSTTPGENLFATLEYIIDDPGPPVPGVLTFSVGGELEVGVRPFRFIAPFDFTIVAMRLACGTGLGPTGSGLLVDWLNNATSVFATTPANRPTIADGADDGAETPAPDTTSISTGDVGELEIVNIGSTTPGENLSLMIEITVP